MRLFVLLITTVFALPLLAHDGHGVPGLEGLLHYLLEPEHWLYILLFTVCVALLIRNWRQIWRKP